MSVTDLMPETVYGASRTPARRPPKTPPDRWYVALWWGRRRGRRDDDREKELLAEAEATGRKELEKTLDVMLPKCNDDPDYYVVIRRSRLLRTGAGLVEIRPELPPEVIMEED